MSFRVKEKRKLSARTVTVQAEATTASCPRILGAKCGVDLSYLFFCGFVCLFLSLRALRDVGVKDVIAGR